MFFAEVCCSLFGAPCVQCEGPNEFEVSFFCRVSTPFFEDALHTLKDFDVPASPFFVGGGGGRGKRTKGHTIKHKTTTAAAAKAQQEAVMNM